MSSAEKKFAEDCLAAINSYRSYHQVEPLSYSHDIELISRKWVDHLTQSNAFDHNPDRNYRGNKLGENLASQSSSSRNDITGAEIAELWYSEVEKYDFDANRGRGTTGHFTQVVWKDSKEMGIARSKTRDGTWIIVANFFPPGNFNNDYANNVFPTKDGKKPPLTKKDPIKESHADSQHSAKSSSSSKQVKQSKVNGVSTTTTTETNTYEDGVKKVKVTEKVERPGAAPKVKVTLTTTNPDGATSEETWAEEEQSRPTKALSPSTNDKTPTDKDFCRDVVYHHNKLRQNHHDTDELILNEKLTDLAQSWSDHLAQTKSLQHSKMTYEGQAIGESIASKHGTGPVDYTADEVVSQWYKEVEKYDFRNPPDSQSGTGTGHFTQVVWKNTREIGVGKAFSRDNRVYVVALYYPAGNYVGRENYKSNVQPLKHE